jgi:hypothetical protein
MSLDRYDLTSSEDRLTYEFYSDGPKGEIKKVVQFTKLKSLANDIYNLGFGDFNKETGEVDDLTVSNNKDRDLILQTVASTVPFFLEKYPTAQITFNGSTEARTRLYLMQISKRLADLDESFQILGLKDEAWESFQKNGRYKAILVTRRKPVN